MRKSTKSALQGLLSPCSSAPPPAPPRRRAAPAATDGPAKPASPILTAADQPQAPDEVVERVRLKVTNAHVFKLPPKPSAGGWRGAEWRDKVWQGTLKVVERGEETAVLLVDNKEEKNIFAVCPIRHNFGRENKRGERRRSVHRFRRGTSCCASRRAGAAPVHRAGV